MRNSFHLFLVVNLLVTAGVAGAQDSENDLPDDLPAWVHEVGARHVPQVERTCPVTDYGARPDTSQTSTRGIQQAIDACAEAGGGVVTFVPGRYLTGALFVKSNVHLRVDDGVTLYCSHDVTEYRSARCAWLASR